MSSRFLLGTFTILLSLGAGAGCTRSAVTDTPAAGTPAAATELEPRTITLFGERTLLFLEYPHLVKGDPARFLAHFSVLADGEPVRSGRVVLEAGGNRLVADAPRRDGLFVPEGTFASAGTWPARLHLVSDQATETLELGDLVVHAGEAESRAAAEAEASDDPSGAVPFLMEQQWKLSLLLAEAGPRRVSRRLAVPAQAKLAEDASALVHPPVAGRLARPAGEPWPRTGDRVEAGQLLAFVVQPLTASELAQLRALEWEFDRQALEIERAISEAVTRLQFAQMGQARIEKLRASGLSTQQELEAAERDVALASSAMQAARDAQAALQRLRPGRADEHGDAHEAALQLPIRAPIGGVLAGAGRVTGESVEASDLLFRIVDPTKLWVVGRVSEFDLPDVGARPQAFATFAALPGRSFRLGAGDAPPAAHIAPELDTVSRTLAIRFDLPDPDGILRAGMLGELELDVGTVDAAVVIPFEAVVMDQGQPVAFVMLDGEMFQKRDLELGVRDGDVVEVLAGVEAGEHVATRGAATIRLASMSPASFGAGHAH